MTMLRIPAGSFLRKDTRFADAIEQKVTLTRSFLLSDREVSRAQYQRFIDDPDYPVEEKPKDWSGPAIEFSPTDQHAVQRVSWHDALLFCNWLSRNEGLIPCYERTGEKEKINDQEFDAWRLIPKASGYRLPTEAEWEYSCRAGTVTTFGYGNDESSLDRYAVYASDKTELPGSKLPNAWGLFDLHGNVFELCQDWYGAYGHEAAVTDPVGPARETRRAVRGGSFAYARNVRSDARYVAAPGSRKQYIGLRVARTYP